MDYKETESTIIITESQFDEAVMAEMEEIIHDPDNKDARFGAFAFAMGGAAFARKVWNRLTKED